jgi:hypothetical protein
VPRPALTVVVCTRNRAALLRGCLECLAAQRLTAGTLEVLVVDNGSTDGTAAVISSHDDVRGVAEPTPGLSHARNTGLDVASGDLVAFLDDDARAEPRWAEALVGARSRWPAATALGGPVVLQWSRPPPRWLTRDLERWYSAVDHGPAARLLDPDERPVGTNFAVVRDEALAAGAFAVELGRKGASLGSEEEVELLTRLLGRGGSTGWEPGARVRHLVAPNRMTRRWLLRRAWAQGCSDTAVARLGGDISPPTAEWRAAAAALLRGWPGALRDIAAAPMPQGAFVQELVRRARRLGRASTALSQPARRARW